MELQKALLEEIIEKSDSGKIALNQESQVILWNKWITVQSGIQPTDAMGHLLTDIFKGSLPSRLLSAIANAIRFGMNAVLSHSFTPHPLPLKHPFQEGLMFQKITVQALKSEPGKHFCLIDITDVSYSVSREAKLHEQSESLKHMAKHDPLTGLANRALFHEYLVHTFERSRRKKTKFAVMYLDLDKFKQINDTMGHHIGDMVLQGFATRLSQLVRASDVVSRLGGDEFTILADSLAHEEEAAIVARKILHAFSKPITCEDREITVSLSIGIATYPRAGDDSDLLVRNADAALYKAKELGRNNYQFFTPVMNTKATQRLTLEKDLRLAVDREEFLIYYQPQIDLKTNAIVGAEALLRWNHPEKGILAPAHFLALASETGLIVPIGEWVMEKACAQMRSWSTNGLAPFRVAINISGHHFRIPGAMDVLVNVLKKAGVDPDFVEIELTEEVLIERVDQNVEALWKLREMGVKIAIDDFGTGYSSLSYLKHFPIDTLKIDRSFVMQLLASKKDAIITKGVISLAHDLGLKVVAEGVETADQLPFLIAQNCDEGQGYLYSRPIPPNDFWAYYLKSQRELESKKT